MRTVESSPRTERASTRLVRILVALTAVTVLAGVFAGAALAAKESEAPQFKASKESSNGPAPFPLTIKGVNVGPLEMVFKKIKVVCHTAKVKGSIATAESKSISLTVNYKNCTVGPIIVFGKKTEDTPMKFKEKGEYTYHYNGWINSHEEIEMKAKYLDCVVDWDSGIWPEKAEENEEGEYNLVSYATDPIANGDTHHFPLGTQNKLLLTNEVHHMEWEEEGGGICENEDIELAEGENGKYEGALLLEVVNGNLEV